MSLESFWFVVNVIGLIGFSISGSIQAIECNFDFFGVLTLGLITTIGGGTIRDAILGRYKNSIFIDQLTIIIVLSTSIIFYIIWKLFYKNKKTKKEYKLYIYIFLISDAIGLSAFTITGSKIATEHNLDIIPTALIATVTCIGGGIIKDVLSNRVPTVLKKEIYGTLSFIGGIIFWIAHNQNLQLKGISIIIFFSIITIRLASLKFKWNIKNRTP